MKSTQALTSDNFGFLAEHDPLLVQIAAAAERAFASDPNTTLIKLRQLGEALAQNIAARIGLPADSQTSQKDLLYTLNRELQFDPMVRELFHGVRIQGNKATHEFQTRHRDAMDGLKVARALAVWFHQSFGKAGSSFKAGPFVAPTDPSSKLNNLQTEIEALKHQLLQASADLEDSQQLQLLVAQEKAEYEELAEAMDEESRAQAALAQTHEAALEQQRQEFDKKLQALQQQLAKQGDSDQRQQRQQVEQQTRSAAHNIVLSEELTRILIDQQLIDAGWQADSEAQSYARGARPENGKNKAIAEWPTNENGKRGRADYVLFLGLCPVAVVEAKKENTNVSGKISQAERYSRGFAVDAPLEPAWMLAKLTMAWPDSAGTHFNVPFAYSCNGRPYVPQLAEMSGTWFRDLRSASNSARSVQAFHSPDGLLDMLKRNISKAEEQLAGEPFAYLKLRDYQINAIKSVEHAVQQNKRTALLAMATGTGKTRTIIGLIYRFLKVERFKRILFLVDRRTLGKQAQDAFDEAPLEQNQSLTTIYNVAKLGDMAAEAETRVQVATVQAMVKRIFASDTPPTVDEFDCIIIDEAHRGYTLDQEMTDGELATRDAAQYLSSYRRVLDYFDAVKVGLTATPAQHTTEIFGKPVYNYSYREAVADDWLIDHEPPIRYETVLTRNGIKFEKGQVVQAINTQTGEVAASEMPDDVNFDVESFNRRVVNENFNRVICQQLAKELDPFGEEKTLIFCCTDLHADMVKRLLDEAFTELYNGDYQQSAVAKITGQSDKVDTLILRYKNERHPNIAITVDLLTTGVDVPSISHVVFMRRIKSRILYEQMIGRATRRCDEIGKTVFRIYDPVDIYASLQQVNTMKPLVKNPLITMEQLASELTDPQQLKKAMDSPGELDGESQADAVLSQLSQKLMRVLRKADHKALMDPKLNNTLTKLHESWEVEPKSLHSHLQQLGPRGAAQFLQQHAGLLRQVSEIKEAISTDYRPIISEHDDELAVREQNYGKHQRPEDYLDSFKHFVEQQLNQNAALAVVVKRPRDLTRAQLKEVKLLLDGQGYSEANLQSAVRQQSNQDIAASIIGHIRRAALGEALQPFEQRVAQAMDRIYTSHSWQPNQRKWLERLAKQLVFEVIVDREFVNTCFAEDGGARRLDSVLDKRLDAVLEDLSEALWAA